ncbi:MAG: EAL domain-containing protein [Peptococcaceae bacterium]
MSFEYINNNQLFTGKHGTSYNQQLLDIIEFLPDATFVVDREGKVIAWNLAIEEMTGIKKADILGKNFQSYSRVFYEQEREMLVNLHTEDKEYLLQKYDYYEKKGNTLFAEIYLPAAFGKKDIYIWAASSPLFDAKGNIVGAIESIRDISERRKMENQLAHMATHDFLTNAPNRYSLEEGLRYSIKKTETGIISALLLLDIDNFKLINGTLGHNAGDRLLISLSELIKRNLRTADILFRFGGDEFAVILRDVTEDGAREIAETIRKTVEEWELCLTIWGTCLEITVSIGIVMIDGRLNYEKLLNYADTAMYKAKEEGRNRAVFIQSEEDIATEYTETRRIMRLLKKALRENLFVLQFQPIIRLYDAKEIVHYEVLIRLRGEDAQLISPGVFIPIAERYGLMPQIDRWVIKNALSILRKNTRVGLFLNISGVSLGNDELLMDIEDMILRSKIDPKRIGFEVTETVAVKDLLRAKKWIEGLKRIGCKFALDDFGMGFSSFSYLRTLPVDYLKLDGSFVRNITKDTTNFALIEAMNNIAHTLGKQTIAEFVENEEIVKVLQGIGVDYGQGFFLGKPGEF